MSVKMLFVNIGWMNEYAGPKKNDPTIGGHGYLKECEHGHECYNFLDVNGFCYGYVPKSSGVNINNLGAVTSEAEVEDVLVVWMAKSPFNSACYVVGWYEHATVYRKAQDHDEAMLSREGAAPLDYGVKAEVCDCKLISTEDRVFYIPHNSAEKGGYGQSPLWYASEREDIKREVLAYIRGNNIIPDRLRAPRRGPGRAIGNVDPEKRKQVEIAAVNVATDYYNSKGYTVVSREAENVGWDLDVENAIEFLAVEVKGLSAKKLSVELTANEYATMDDEYASYVLFIVTEALTEKNMHIFRHCNARDEWIDQFGNVLDFEERVSATASSC